MKLADVLRKVLLAALFLATSLHAAEFPMIYDSEPDANAAPPSPQESLAQLKLPPGFTATIFAAEPDVQNPISMSWDARGRLWVAENYTYSEGAIKFNLNLRDRILIFEDSDGDGHFDSRKIFSEEAQRLMSIEVGRGGVWALCPPQLLFYPDKNGDDVADAAPEVFLEGFEVPSSSYHTVANGLRWGPDGWLYGRCGASSPGEIGATGSLPKNRVPIRGGIWRYHPSKKIFEVLATGTVNPWGYDWDKHGELFFINTVGGHLWHMISGGHFVRALSSDPNDHVYKLIEMHADHWHFDTGKSWRDSRDGAADSMGGGHAHAGAMIYQGDNWPDKFHNHLFTLNLHGRRVNEEILERSGSGYVAHHGTDDFLFGDNWFRGLDLSYGPDGGVFVLDWSDTGECHEHTGVHRTSGRIYKIVYGKPTLPQVGDLAKLSVGELVKLQEHTNEWFVRQSRLELAERAVTGHEFEIAKTQLREMFSQEKNPVMQLRTLWSLNAIGGADDDFLRGQLRHPDEHIRTWAIRLLTDFWPLDTVMSVRPSGSAELPVSQILKDFIRLAKSDSSGLVRLALASALQRFPVSHRAELAAPLLAHVEDASDHNLPLMIWYGLIPLGDSDPAALVALATDCQIPLTRKLIARRLGEDIEKNPAPLNDLLKLSMNKPEAFQSDILAGPTGQKHGTSDARVWIRRSRDLEIWGEPELLRVKGSDVPREKMGRMIDPYLLEDKDAPGKWWCFFKQNGASMSWSHDLTNWTYSGRVEAGENVCVLVVDGEYVMFHSPGNGIGMKRSHDLKIWRDDGLITLGQKDWPWARGRLTAGFVLDLKNDSRIGKYLMFFHGSGPEDERTMFDNFASIGIAWSDDLQEWNWPGKLPSRENARP